MARLHGSERDDRERPIVRCAGPGALRLRLQLLPRGSEALGWLAREGDRQMRSRGLVVAIAVVLAVLAAVGVIVYTSNVKEKAIDEGTVPVIVSSQDIPASTELDPLIAQGVFTTANVPSSVVVSGAVTTTDELQGKTATAPIYANEAIPLARVTSTNVLGISPGNIGLGLQVDGAAAVNGSIAQGDNVAIWATFPRGSLVTRSSLKSMLTPSQITQLAGGTSSSKVISVP